MDNNEHKDWDTAEEILEDWIRSAGLTFKQKQSLIPVRDFIFDRTSEGSKVNQTTGAHSD